jgi:hypothetical protein
LFECSPKSGQSFVTKEYALKVSKELIGCIPDACIIISTNDPFLSNNMRLIDGSNLSFRENAELGNYCTLLVGCSSGISWLCTSEWTKSLPMIQLLKGKTCMFASFIHDHKHFGIPYNHIIERTECSEEELTDCIKIVLTDGIEKAREKYPNQSGINFRNYIGIMGVEVLMKGKFLDLISSVRYTAERWFTDIVFR